MPKKLTGKYFDEARDEFVDVELTLESNGQYFMNGQPVKSFITTYTSIGGPKAVCMWWNDEDYPPGGFYEPWNTWYAAEDMDAAKQDALSWAQAEELVAIV